MSVLFTVLPAGGDSDVSFVCKVIGSTLVYWSYPQDRINAQVMFRFALAQVECALGNCGRSFPSLSLLAGTAVETQSLTETLIRGSHLKSCLPF